MQRAGCQCSLLCPLGFRPHAWMKRSEVHRAQTFTQPCLGVSDGLVGEEGEAITYGAGVDEAHGFLGAGLDEEALAGPSTNG